jgi:hypothetical protein
MSIIYICQIINLPLKIDTFLSNHLKHLENSHFILFFGWSYLSFFYFHLESSYLIEFLENHLYFFFFLKDRIASNFSLFNHSF